MLLTTSRGIWRKLNNIIGTSTVLQVWVDRLNWGFYVQIFLIFSSSVAKGVVNLVYFLQSLSGQESMLPAFDWWNWTPKLDKLKTQSSGMEFTKRLWKGKFVHICSWLLEICTSYSSPIVQLWLRVRSSVLLINEFTWEDWFFFLFSKEARG